MNDNVKLVRLVTLTDQVKAEMLQNLLEEADVKCILQSTASHSVHPFTVDGLAEIKVMINKNDLDAAKNVLEGFEFL